MQLEHPTWLNRRQRAGPRCVAGAAILATALFLALAAPARAAFTLTILHINDVHSRLQPVNAHGAPCPAGDDAAGRCLGGVARIKALVDARRQALNAGGEPVIVLDAGDQFQGSLYFTTYRGAAAAEFMNAVGFDAMAVGNHEFDDGPETLARFADALDFPLLAANLDVSGSPALAGRIARYTVVNAGSERVGIVGAVTEDTAEISSPGPDVSFSDATAAIARAVDELGARGIDKIIALTHLGLSRDREIARTVAGVDVVVGGHSHTLLSAEPGAEGPYPVIENGTLGSPVAVVQAGAYSRHLGELRVRFDDAGRVVEAAGHAHVLDASIVPDPAVAARVAELAQPFESLMAEVVGHVAAPVNAGACRSGECEMGNLVADAMLARTRNQGIEVALVNGGGLRAGLDAGPVTRGEILAVLPFGNTLSTFRLRGDALRDALENGVSRAGEGAGRFPQVAGLAFEWSPGAAPGERITRVRVRDGDGWQGLDPRREYGVVSIDFLRRGGDGYSVLRDEARQAYDFGPSLDEVVADFLTTHTDYRPGTDGRIVRAD